MKNVAKCDTWCELQNPANHRVFERKLRPRPSGRGHACLGVTHRVAPRPHGRRTRRLAPRARARRAQARAAGGDGHGEWWTEARTPRARAGRRGPRPQRHRALRNPTGRASPSPGTGEPPRTATPGQAGPPAEFKHINKRRRRNLRGFP